MIEFKKHIHHYQETEEAILGVCLLEKLAFGRTYGLVDEDSFYFSAHQKVYSAMKEMYDNNLPLDIFTVTEFLVAQRGIEKILDYDVQYFLVRLTNCVVSSAHLEYHCHIVKEMWRRREVLKLRSTPGNEVDTYRNLEEINAKINQIVGTGVRKDWYDMTELIFNLIIHQSEMAKGDKEFLTTGFRKIDNLNGGFFEGNMIIIGARPSVGKSALMGQMALSMAKKGKKVGIVSLEMNNIEITARLASMETNIDFSRVYRDIAKDQALHEQFYNIVSKNTINLPIFVSDKTKVNISEIRAKAIKLKHTKGCDCIIVDYLQLVDSHTENKNYNREQEVSRMSRGIKLMAQELKIPVIVLCQLNRAVTQRAKGNRFPQLSDLRESGSLEQDADVVMFIHRDYAAGIEQDEEGNSTEFQADLLGAKWRNGATFHLPLDFEPTKMRFKERSGFVPYKPTEDQIENINRDNPF